MFFISWLPDSSKPCSSLILLCWQYLKICFNVNKLILIYAIRIGCYPPLNANQVPKGLEMAIGTMVREEKAVIYVTSQYLTESPLMPVIEGYDEVHFEVELVHFIQVSNTFLTKLKIMVYYWTCLLCNVSCMCGKV